MIVSRSDENFTACEKERKPGKHLVWEDQGAIEAMKGLGQSNQPLARYLNCSPATVSMEARMKPARADSKRFFSGRRVQGILYVDCVGKNAQGAARNFMECAVSR